MVLIKWTINYWIYLAGCIKQYYIGSYTFYYFEKITSINKPTSIMKVFIVSNSLSISLKTQNSTINIKDEIATIGSYAFNNFNKLSSITIPNCVISIIVIVSNGNDFWINYCYCFKWQ